MNYSYIILIIILLFISIINLYIISLHKYYIDYYLSYEKTCQIYIPELMSFKYNIINYYISNNNTNNQKLFRYSNLIIVIIISIIFFATIQNYIKEPLHFISILILSFIIIFMICYIYVDKIYTKTDNIINDYNNYYEQYNAIVKYAYEKNNNNFIDEYVYRKNIEKYESNDSLKPIDINLILKKRYDNNDFMKYFILDNTDNYFNNLNINIFNFISKLELFNDNIINGDYANIFKDNKIDILNLKPEYSKYLLDVNYSINNNSTPISLVDQDSNIDINIINNIIVNKNNKNNYNLTIKVDDHDSDFDNNLSIIYALLNKLYKTYMDHYDLLQDYTFYKKISLNNISINISNYDYIKNITNINKENLHNYLLTDYIDGKIQYYIKIVDIYTITETRKNNNLNISNIAFISQLYNEIKLSHPSLANGIKLLYEITNYMHNERFKKYFTDINTIISIYISLFIFIFAIILKFIVNYFL